MAFWRKTSLREQFRFLTDDDHVRVVSSHVGGTPAKLYRHARADALQTAQEIISTATMRGGDRDTVDAFEQAVAAIPHVREAQRLFGEPDYLLRVITADLAAYQELYDERLATLPGVQRLSSTLVMKSVVENRPLPL